MNNHFRLVIISVGLSLLLLAVPILLAPDAMTRSASAKPVPQSGERTESRSADQPTELGDVDWLRDLDKAVDQSKQQDKPIAILFQEVPG